MRLLYVVQRYGDEVGGGAEIHCRRFATRMAARGHRVDVVTSCAVSHTDWANVYPAGESDIDGVRVHRLPVPSPKDERAVARLNTRVNAAGARLPLSFQRFWIERQGPYLPSLPAFLAARAGSYDAVIFFTYLWYPTWAGLPVASPLAPTVLHPTAHDEPALALRVYDTTFRHPWGFAFSTAEEADLVRRRFRPARPSDVIGIGTDLDGDGDGGARPDDEAVFRAEHGLGDRPYLLFVGRVEGGKGALELWEFLAAYKERNPGPLALVMVGQVVEPLPPHPDVVATGFVDEAARRAALRGALALVQPSFFESFSMVLTEAWAERKPALVQGHSDVLVGQARRSGGAIPYRGFAEFEAAVDRLTGDAGLARALGAAGRRFVEGHYGWDGVLDRYEALLRAVAVAGPPAAVPGR